MELQSAIERLYTDESLAADVDDATAQPLLKWAEAQLPAIIAKFGDTGFDDAFVTLKKLVKSVARLIDMRGEIDEVERAERVEKINGFAQELGVSVDLSGAGELVSESGPEIVAQVLSIAAPLKLEAEVPTLPLFTDKATAAESSLSSVPVLDRSTGDLEGNVEQAPQISAEPAPGEPESPPTGLQSLFRRFIDKMNTLSDPETPDTKE